jgi:acyl-CoA hydrolase
VGVDETDPIDLRQAIRPGDTVLWGQGTGEPRTLTEALVRQRAELGGVDVFLGSMFSDTLDPSHADHLRFRGIGGMGTNAALARAGVLDVLPCHISAIPGLIESGRLPVDVVMVQVSEAGPDGRHSLGLIADYLGAALTKARTVVAEINDQVPRTRGAWVEAGRFDMVVRSSRPPVMVADGAPGPTEERIAALVASLVPDGAVVQLGVGSIAGPVGRALVAKRELGIHAGVVGDWVVDLVEAGAVTNSRKAIDTGLTVTGGLFGTRRLYDFAHDNPAIELRPLSYTHDPAVLRRLEGLVAVNSAVEVDLGGQVNAETVNGVHIGAVGGQVDFVRAAMASPGGRSVIALPSTAKGGRKSRIVLRPGDCVTTSARSDADTVVTEYGVADLRGATLGARAERLIAIAHPAFRDELASAVRRLGRLC